jgi:hypothetical protein
MLKKLVLLAALLAMLAVAAIPAMAQLDQATEQEGESGELDQSVEGSLEGDNSSQCSNPQLTGNTGNAQTTNQAISYLGTDPSPSGNAEITLTPNEDVDEVFQCTVETNQAASASG